MVHAFVMVTADGPAAETLASLDAVDAVTEAHAVAGDYDLVVELEAADVREVLDVVSRDVGRIDGVADTRTYVSLGATDTEKPA